METDMIIGFTGTQRGMTADQRRALHNILFNRDGEFRHGDCVGADAEAHDIAEAIGLEPVIHPPTDPRKRAWKKAKRILPPKPYIERNHDIVDAAEEMFATPGEYHEQMRSGTWATIRYARKRKKMLTIIFPDGSVQYAP
jgi:hypothetical protein